MAAAMRVDPRHPLLLKIRGVIENYANYLEYGDPGSIETLPEVYKGPEQEIEALSKSIPDTAEEEKYLSKKYESVLSDIERTRLLYFDQLYGTNTYFHEVGLFQERIGFDLILERMALKYHGGRFQIDYRELLIGVSNQAENKHFLRHQTTRQDIEGLYWNERLIQLPSKLVDPLGNSHPDPYRYLHPETLGEEDRGVAIRYMNIENKRFFSNLYFKNNIHSRLVDELSELMSQSSFYELIPYFHKSHVYLFSRHLQGVFRVASEEFQAKFKLHKEDALDMVGADHLLHQSIESREEYLKACGVSNPETLKGLDLVWLLPEITEYFFCFKDQFSFAICRYLKNNGLVQQNVQNIYIDPTETYMILTLSLIDHQISLLIDIESKKVFKNYFPNKGSVQFEILARESDQQFFLVSVKTDKNSLCLEKVPISKDDFIVPKAKAEEIPSVIRYIKEHQETLLENLQFQKATLEALQIHEDIVYGEMMRLNSQLYLKVRDAKSFFHYFKLNSEISKLEKVDVTKL
jgi:hypothetical protein